MSHIDRVAQSVVLIRLRRGKANAIDRGFLRALNQALDRTHTAHGLILTGQGRFFSVGLDLREVFPLDREEMASFMTEFIATLRRVLTWPGPTVAAINGHALGGGFLLALACDRRFAIAGSDARIGFPDVEEQVPLSHSLRLMALHALPRDQADLVNGKAANFAPEEAARRRIVELVAHNGAGAKGSREARHVGSAASESVDPLIAHALRWASSQPADYAERKAQRLAPLLAQLDALGGEDIQYFLDRWFAADTRAAFRKVWERIRR